MENLDAVRMYILGLEMLGSVRTADSYIAELPVTKTLLESGPLRFKKPVTFFVGENGTGKSTLLEAIAVCNGYNPEGGTVNFNFATKESHSELYHHIRLRRSPNRRLDGFFLRAESFYNVATELDKLYEGEGIPRFYGGKSMHEQSHGESFMSLILNRFAGDGLYILDEPEAALSPTRQMALLAAIDSLVKARSQFIISTHSPILLAYPHADIYELKEDSIELTPYEETEHYRVTRQFLNNPSGMMKYIFGEEDEL